MVFIGSIIILLMISLVVLPEQLFIKQLIYSIIGLACLCLLARVDYRLLKKHSWIFIWAGLGLLILPLIPGIARPAYDGVHRWAWFGFIYIMPFELVQFLLIVFIAQQVAETESTRNILIFSVIILFILLLQQDIRNLIFGCLILVIFAVLISSKALVKIYCILLSIAVCVALTKPYVMYRLIHFCNRDDVSGGAYQLMQSYNTIISGGLFGNSVSEVTEQAKLLPYAYTGYIFSVFTCRFGLVGALVILGLFCYFLWYSYDIMKKCKDKFGFLLSAGIIVLITVQTALHIGVCLGLIVTCNICLPFVSYFGMSQIFYLGAVGVVLSISRFGNKSGDVLEGL